MATRTVYAATWIEKTATAYVFNEGCSIDGARTIICEGINVTAPTFKELISEIEKDYYLEVKDLLLPDEEEGVKTICLSRLETGGSEVPTKRQIEKWENNKIKLYLCYYRFTVEKRIISPIDPTEFVAAGIKSNL